MRERAFYQTESEIILSDGAKEWFEISIQPVPEGLLILSKDITERKQSQEKMQLGKRHARSVGGRHCNHQP